MLHAGQLVPPQSTSVSVPSRTMLSHAAATLLPRTARTWPPKPFVYALTDPMSKVMNHALLPALLTVGDDQYQASAAVQLHAAAVTSVQPVQVADVWNAALTEGLAIS